MVALAAAAAVLAPVATSPAAAQSSGSGDGAVVIANGWSPADVGAAAPLADRLGAAVLYASKGALGQPTVDALEELAPSRVLLMGGPAALTSAVESQVRRTLSGATVERFSGTDRIDTAAKAALSTPTAPAGRTVVIASGWSPPDVGAAAALAASLGGTVLFANKNSLGAPTVTALRRLAPSQIIVVGGTAALSGGIESQIAAATPAAPIERLDGIDRVDTVARGAEFADVGPGEPVVLADGWSPADVGIAAPLAAALGGNVPFIQRNALGDRAIKTLASLSPSRIILIGGSDRLSETVGADIELLHPGTPRVNIAGPDRIATAALAALIGVQLSGQRDRLADAVATIARGEADCSAAPSLTRAGIHVVDAPDDLNDITAPLTVAEVVRIADGCVLVEYVALDGRTTAEIRQILTDEPTVFAVGEPLRGFELLHPIGAHAGYGSGGSGAHYNDGFREQWHLPANYMEPLWESWDEDNPIGVAVIDSGFDVDHPDLRDRIMDTGLDGCHREFEDRNDIHGTHVAGIIAAEHGNDFGVSGIAPEARILPIRLEGCNLGIAEILEHALNVETVNVINMSFAAWFTERRAETCAGSSVETPRGLDDWRLEDPKELRLRGGTFELRADCDVFAQMLNIADQLGVVTVAGAGNSGHCGPVFREWEEARRNDPQAEIEDNYWCMAIDPDTWVREETPNPFSLPAGYTSTIAVANIDLLGDRANSSTQQSYVDVAAPGTDILSTFPVDPRFGEERAFGVASGTSMATPFVAGVAAHMLNRYPDATPAEVRQALIGTAADRGKPLHDEQYGHGVVRPREAIYRLREIVGYNQIERISVTASTCAADDETPSCLDPVTLLEERLDPQRGRISAKFLLADIPRQTPYITVNAKYTSDGRPGQLHYSLPDTGPAIADHQLRLRNDRQELEIYTPDWQGNKSLHPSVHITFNRASLKDDARLTSLKAWSTSCDPDECPGGSLLSTAPGFDADVETYTATAPKGTQIVTVEGIAEKGFELSSISPPDADPSTPGHQVRLSAAVSVPKSDRADKPGTSAAVGERFLEVVGADWSGAVIVASAENFPDGLAAASLAGSLRAPILLTPKNRLDPAIAKFASDNDVSEVIIMGGPAAIDDSVERALQGIVGANAVSRIWGVDRYHTAVRIAKRVAAQAGQAAYLCGTNQRAVFIATGRNSADALAASPAAYAAETPVLLVDPRASSLHPDVRAFIRDHRIDTAVILGGTKAVPQHLQEQLDALSTVNRVTRVAGADRYTTAAGLAHDITSKCYADGTKTIGLADGRGFADALSAGPLVAELEGVMLLTQPDDVPPATIDAMTRIGREAQLTNITLSLLAVGDIAEADNAVTQANTTTGRRLRGDASLRGIKVIDIEGSTSCALRASGAIACWGRNQFGLTEPPDGRFRAIDLEDRHACAIRTDNTVACWGANGRGQSDAPDGQFASIHLTAFTRSDRVDSSCGITIGGRIRCWGSDSSGLSEPPPGRFISLWGSSEKRCAIGIAFDVECWGSRPESPGGTFLALAGTGEDFCGIRIDGGITCWPERRDVPQGAFETLDSEDNHFCGIRTDRAVACWGSNRYGKSDPPSGEFTAVAVGDHHSCAIRTNGTIVCWGRSSNDRLQAPDGEFTAIDLDDDYACAIKTDGTVACWGSNSHGKSAPPSGTFLPEAPELSGIDAPPLTTDVQSISAPVGSEPADTASVDVKFEVTDPTNQISTKTYRLTIRTD